jgi:hypothetical protein
MLALLLVLFSTNAFAAGGNASLENQVLMLDLQVEANSYLSSIDSQIGNISGGGGGGSTGGLTNNELRASPLVVTGSFYQPTQPVSVASTINTNVQNFPSSFLVSNFPNFPSSFSVSNLPTTQAVSGTFWQSIQPVSGTLTCNAGSGTQAVSIASTLNTNVQNFPTSFQVSNFPSSQAVTGSFYPTIQVVSYGSTQAIPVTIASMPTTAVTGTFFQPTQPVSIASSVTTSVSNFPATQAVTGTFFQSVQPVSANSLPLPAGAMQDHTTAASFASIRLSDGAAFYKPTTPTDTQPVSIASTVTVTGTVTASGPLTDTQLRNSDVSIRDKVSENHTVASSYGSFRLTDGSAFFKPTTPSDTQPVSIAAVVSASISNFPATQTVSFTTPISAAISNFPAAQTVSFTTPISANIQNFPATQTVSFTTPISIVGTVTASGPLTNSQLQADVVSIYASQLPTSLGAKTVANSMSVNIASDQILVVSYGSAVNVPVSGPLTNTQLLGDVVSIFASQFPASLGARTIAQSLGVNIASDQIVPASLANMAAATSIPTAVVSIGNSLGKTNVIKTASFASSALTADQVALTYTVTSGKTFYLEYLDMAARLTTYAATATNFGNCSLESPAGTKLYTNMLAGSGITPQPIFQQFSEPLAIASGVVVRIVCTPAATTATIWQANFGGYEK